MSLWDCTILLRKQHQKNTLKKLIIMQLLEIIKELKKDISEKKTEDAARKLHEFTKENKTYSDMLAETECDQDITKRLCTGTIDWENIGVEEEKIRKTLECLTKALKEQAKTEGLIADENDEEDLAHESEEELESDNIPGRRSPHNMYVLISFVAGVLLLAVISYYNFRQNTPSENGGNELNNSPGEVIYPNDTIQTQKDSLNSENTVGSKENSFYFTNL